MSPALRFALVLLAALALLTWTAFSAVNRTVVGWFEQDLALRAELAVNGAQKTLASYWRSGSRDEMRLLLAGMASDERLLGAAFCPAEAGAIVATVRYPPSFACAELLHAVQPSPDVLPGAWQTLASVGAARLHLTAIPLSDGSELLGVVAFVHDMTYVDRRQAEARRFLLIAFAILAVAAPIVTIVAARLSWRGWNREIRRFLRSARSGRREFQPILTDVRELVEQMSLERTLDSQSAVWTAHRLRQVLTRHFHGEKIVIVANREPYIHEHSSDGTISTLNPASGLVTALEPVMRACSGVWIAHGGGTADRETADRHGRLRVPPGEESYVLRRVWLSPEEESGYYYGFANEGLWPLCHIAHIRPAFRIDDWEHYRAVNQRFAEAVAAEVDSDDPIVLVQDYHFALAPRYIRELLPRATILTFWHIPWPNAESFGICPWRNELLQGLLGSSILGFHTQFHCNNFLQAVDRFLEARIDREQVAVVQQGQTTRVRAYPISLEWPDRRLEGIPPAAECRAEVFAELALPADGRLGVGVDRLDYTKGIEERLLAVERLLERQPSLRGRFTFLQLAAPSRVLIDEYEQLNRRVDALAARINQRYGRGAYQPVILRRRHHQPPAIFRYYRAADLCYVSSLHDGMNLVAKEFVAARDDERGVLVLSHFTGAAHELTEALVVNPYDLEQASAALATALTMSAEEQQERMRAMRSVLSEFNVYRWAGRMLVDAARLRRRDRLTGRLGERLIGASTGG